MRLVLAAALAATILTGCKSNPTDEFAQTAPAALYESAYKALEGQDWNNAIRRYEALTSRFPFAPETQQARLDLIYCYYRGREPESAIDAADTFIRENPTSPRVDYAWYLKGLTDFERTPNTLERLFRVNLSERPPQTANSSFNSFKTIVEKYPRSDYAHDAQRRMIYLRNRLADYELYVAEYYLKRGAYVAAAQRAKLTIELYDGSPAVRRALEIMIESYDKLGATVLAEQSRTVYIENFPNDERRVEEDKSWWKFW